MVAYPTHCSFMSRRSLDSRRSHFPGEPFHPLKTLHLPTRPAIKIHYYTTPEYYNDKVTPATSIGPRFPLSHDNSEILFSASNRRLKVAVYKVRIILRHTVLCFLNPANKIKQSNVSNFDNVKGTGNYRLSTHVSLQACPSNTAMCCDFFLLPYYHGTDAESAQRRITHTHSAQTMSLQRIDRR